MEVNKVKLIYFSPTGTTQKVLESIAAGIAVEDVEHINLTLPGEAQEATPPFSDDLVIIGAPVYGGRLPGEMITRFKQLKAANTPAVLVVVYGNREFEDSLLELKNISTEMGFTPVAGSAFIGEHSFATDELPIANGRPDSHDVQKAFDFGKKVKDTVTALQSADAQADLEVSGEFPYKAAGARPISASPVTLEDKCTACGTCADVCPTAAITINGGVNTEVELCIRCCACIKSCPEEARIMENEMLKNIASWLNENCKARKEPRFFW